MKELKVPGGDHILWKGTGGRGMSLSRPCSCGCDNRDGWDGVGYLIGCDDEGNGFTLLIDDEAVYRQISRVLGDTVEVDG